MFKKDKIIQISSPSLGLAEQQAVKTTMAGGWIGQGQKVNDFEEACKQLIGCKYFIAVSSCTKAIEIALILSSCKSGDHVIIPSITYPSVIQTLLNLNLVPVFVDIDRHTLNLSINDIKEKITWSVKFIIPVHFRGVACDIEAIKQVTEGYDIKIIEDAAHAFGSTFKLQPIGEQSYAACFSFGPLKNITCIEGGGIATNCASLAESLIRYRNLGAELSTWQRFESVNNDANTTLKKLTIYGAGGKCQMTDISAAVGLVQISRIDEIKAKRNTLANRYQQAFKNIEQIVFPGWNEYHNLLYIFVIIILDNSREALISHLQTEGILTTIHYPPNHLQPYFAHLTKQSLPETEYIGEHILSIPYFTDLTQNDQDRIIDSIFKFYRHIRR